MEKLKRSSKQKIFAGVCGGIGEYFDVDPVVVRAIFILTALFGFGTSILVYFVLWIIVPKQYDYVTVNTGPENDEYIVDENYVPGSEDSFENEYNEQNETKKQKRNLFGGILLIFIGLLFLLNQLAPWVEFSMFWPLALIAFGSYIMFKNINKTAEVK